MSPTNDSLDASNSQSDKLSFLYEVIPWEYDSRYEPDKVIIILYFLHIGGHTDIYHKTIDKCLQLQHLNIDVIVIQKVIRMFLGQAFIGMQKTAVIFSTILYTKSGGAN